MNTKVSVKSDLEIAREATLAPIGEMGARVVAAVQVGARKTA